MLRPLHDRTNSGLRLIELYLCALSNMDSQTLGAMSLAPHHELFNDLCERYVLASHTGRYIGASDHDHRPGLPKDWSITRHRW